MLLLAMYLIGGEVFSNISAPIFSRQRGNVIKRERKTMSLKGGLKKEK